ncbi:phosphoribosylanthranilate isomerase [Saonia flava]
MRLKICGMNKNTTQVAGLHPDYLGFIFWEPSKRYLENDIPAIPHSIKKVGVFVNAYIDEIKARVEQFGLLLVQLHGKESPTFCNILKKEIPQIKIIKVFSIKDDFDFSVLGAYENVCDYYLFDTKGKLPGGNGYTFNWSVLKDYPSTKPYFLSGGIGLENSDEILSFLRGKESKYCHALDINSKFEIEPGLKNIDKLKEFKNIVMEKQNHQKEKNN